MRRCGRSAQPGLEKTYGIDVAGIDPKGVGTPQAKQAVKDGTDQLVLTTTTDATLDGFGWSSSTTTRSSRTPTTSCRW